MTDDEKLVHNERTKLTATWLNGLAIALAAIGGFAPLISYATNANATFAAPAAGLMAIACLAGSIGLHFIARKTLERLRT